MSGEYYYSFKARGLCVSCGKEVESTRSGKTRCAECSEKENAKIRPRQTERKNWLEEHHICTHCGQEDAEPNRLLCIECSEKSMKSTTQWKKSLSQKKKDDMRINDNSVYDYPIRS